uniref:Uncharacterized protein n=1 Tax=Glossina austeni TaxID=7395 RepID=A0A1A9VN90_GLOAU
MTNCLIMFSSKYSLYYRFNKYMRTFREIYGDFCTQQVTKRYEYVYDDVVMWICKEHNRTGEEASSLLTKLYVLKLPPALTYYYRDHGPHTRKEFEKWISKKVKFLSKLRSPKFNTLTNKKTANVCNAMSCTRRDCKVSPNSLSICPKYEREDACVTSFHEDTNYRGCKSHFAYDVSNPRKIPNAWEWDPQNNIHKARQCQGGCMTALGPMDSSESSFYLIRTCLKDNEVY